MTLGAGAMRRGETVLASVVLDLFCWRNTRECNCLCVAPPIATVPDKVEAPLMVVVPFTLRIPVSVIVAPAPLAV